MNTRSLRSRLKPHLWFQAYWVVYLVWFFWLDLTITDPKYIIHSPIDDFIPFNEWFVFPYCSWFLLLAAVTALLWWNDTESYDKLCLMMFSGMTFCLILYMVLPNGLDIRPTAEAVGRDNIAMQIMQLLWKADASVNVCPSIHVFNSVTLMLAYYRSAIFDAPRRRWMRPATMVLCVSISLSTILLKQHSVIDVVFGLLLALLLDHAATVLQRSPVQRRERRVPERL